VPIVSGCQPIVEFRSTSFWRIAVVRTNQLSVAYWSSGVSQRQQNG